MRQAESGGENRTIRAGRFSGKMIYCKIIKGKEGRGGCVLPFRTEGNEENEESHGVAVISAERIPGRNFRNTLK